MLLSTCAWRQNFNSGEGNRDTLVLRGNSSLPTSSRMESGTTSNISAHFYDVDRIEVLKGPNAIDLRCRGGGGGVINRVTKRSSRAGFEDFILSGDSEGGFRLTADANRPPERRCRPADQLLYRGWRQFPPSLRSETLPALTRRLASSLVTRPGSTCPMNISMTAPAPADRGVPVGYRFHSRSMKPLKGFDRTFLATRTKALPKMTPISAVAVVEHELADGLTLRNHRTSYCHFDKFYQNIYAANLKLKIRISMPAPLRWAPTTMARPCKNFVQPRPYLHPDHRQSLAVSDQTLPCSGFELGRQKSRSLPARSAFLPRDRIPCRLLIQNRLDADVTFARAGTDADNRTRATVAAIYAQDQIRPADWIEIVAGLRFDSFKLHVDDFRPAPLGGEFGRRDQFWSPRLGLILKPSEQFSVYGSFSRSYLPQSGDQFSGLDINTEALKPERFDNYEIGAKWEPMAGLLATAAIYQLDRTNTRVASPDGSGTFQLSGKQRSKGIELGVTGNINSRWQISAGYALQSAKVIEATTACTAGDCKVPLVPRHTVSLWNRYDATQSLGLGLGVIARSKSYATISNQVKLPGYTRVDAAVFYKITPKVEVSSTSKISSGPIISPPPTPTTTSRRVRRQRSAAPSGSGSKPPQARRRASGSASGPRRIVCAPRACAPDQAFAGGSWDAPSPSIRYRRRAFAAGPATW